MRNLRLVVFLASAVLLLAGCNRAWTCWLFRGDPCTTCGTTVESSSTVPPPATLPEPLP
ncbi:MAG: hypothetical protein KatS3mg110_0389 [Pirellulaceae bacterium]|nr:MAG: hypothetical protein KatS3mg110_0389 [Pirellulaceae bacterium]